MTTHPNGCGGEIMTLEAQERQSLIKGCRARLRRELINELTARTPAMGVIETKASKKAIRDGVRQWRETMVERWETLPAPSKDEYKAAIIETINQTVKQLSIAMPRLMRSKRFLSVSSLPYQMPIFSRRSILPMKYADKKACCSIPTMD